MFIRTGTLAGLALIVALCNSAHAEDTPYQTPFGLSTLEIDDAGDVAVDGKILVDTPDNGFSAEGWNECQGPVDGNYIGYPCIRSRGMSPEFLTFMRANMIRCSSAGLARAGGGGRVSGVHIVHDGTLADTRHNRRSLHAAGRAIDILQMRLTTSAGTRTYSFRDTSSRPGGANRKFFEGFRQCWHNLQKARRCPNRKSGNPVGTIGWEDAHHRNHHLHTSMPFCPNRGGWFETSIGETDEAEF